MHSGQWSCYHITVVMDKWINGVEGVALPGRARGGSESREHLSAPALRHRDKLEVAREKERTNVR